MRGIAIRSCLLFLFSLPFLSCDDGDIIVTTLDFTDIQLQNCGEVGDYVFYKIDNENLESISLVLGTDDDIFLTTADLSYNLDGSSNFVNFRSYNGETDINFFCSNVPPSEPMILTDFFGDSGTALLQVTAVNDDNDGLEEDQDDEIDTDNDGLPNYIDFDDDGDNVPTENELDTLNEDGDDDPTTNPLDTDGDGIPNYLDDDDDGDGILTRNEDSNDNADPADDVTNTAIGPDFLNPAVAVETTVNRYRAHSFTLSSSVTITLEDLVLSSGTEELIRETLVLGNIPQAFFASFQATPDFTID